MPPPLAIPPFLSRFTSYLLLFPRLAPFTRYWQPDILSSFEALKEGGRSGAFRIRKNRLI